MSENQEKPGAVEMGWPLDSLDSLKGVWMGGLSIALHMERKRGNPEDAKILRHIILIGKRLVTTIRSLQTENTRLQGIHDKIWAALEADVSGMVESQARSITEALQVDGASPKGST